MSSKYENKLPNEYSFKVSSIILFRVRTYCYRLDFSTAFAIVLNSTTTFERADAFFYFSPRTQSHVQQLFKYLARRFQQFIATNITFYVTSLVLKILA